jgi:hypothetical protein
MAQENDVMLQPDVGSSSPATHRTATSHSAAAHRVAA